MPIPTKCKQRKLNIENGIVIGNITNKQKVGNPISRFLVKNFNKTVSRLTEKVAPNTILEVGCGEGIVTNILLESTEATIYSTDISDSVIAKAKENVNSDRVIFEKRNIYDLLDKQKYKAELVVCCEVMEHLYQPEKGLEKIAVATSHYCLFSIPREPLWHALNLVRGTYIRDLGNTPGHIQHWSKRSFEKFVSPLFEIVETATPLPWTFLLCRVKN